MPTYQVTNPNTGQQISVTGDTPPSESDLDGIFNQVGGQKQQPSPNSQLQQGMSPLGFAGNLIRSTGQQVGNLAQAVVHPIRTVENIGSLGMGLREDVANTVGGAHYNDNNTQLANNLINDYKQRYGGVNNILNTLYNDPAGSAMDAATLLDGVGAIGKIGKIGQLAKLSDVADAVNPLSRITDTAGKVADKVGVGTPLAPFAKSYNPEVDQLAQTLGINLPVSAVTNSKLLQNTEALTSKLPFGQPIINTITDARGKLAQLTQDITNSVNSSPDLKGVGDAIKTGFQNYQDEFRSQKNSLYNAIPADVYQAPADATNTSLAIGDILGRKSQSLLGDNNAGLYQNLKGALESSTGSGTPPTIAQLRQTLTEVGSKLKNGSDPIATGDRASLNQLYGALSQDIDKSINEVNPDAGAALQQATDYYNQGINKINSPLGKAIASADPEKLPDLLTGKNAESKIANVKEIIGPDAFKSLQDNFLASLYQKSLTNDGVLDAGKLQRTLGSYQPGTLNQILSPKHIQELQDIQQKLGNVEKVSNAVKAGTKVTDGSQTGFLGSTATEAGAALLHPLTALKLLIGNYGLGKLFGTPAGKTYLTKGAQVNPGLLNLLNTASRGAGKAALRGGQANNLLNNTQSAQ